MACVTIQLGQCGTQVGHQLFSTLHEDASKECLIATADAFKDYQDVSSQTFFNQTSAGNKEARSVMIDMEPKAVASAVKAMSSKSKSWKYPINQQFCSRSGSGNNWSFGYKVLAPQCEETIMNIVRREVEKCDHFGGFLVLQSLAGGTGSGLGSFVTEKLRDFYPYSSQINAVVCPYADGEVAVQNYNAVLSLAHTCVAADASLLLHNDHLHSICSRLLGIKNVSFSNINCVIANQLALLLQPITNSDNCASSSRCFNVLNSLISTCAPSGQYSMLDLKSLPHIPQESLSFSTFSWNALLKSIRQMFITDFYMDEGLDWRRKLTSLAPEHPKYISNLLIMRGHQALMTEQNMSDFRHYRLYPSWMPTIHRCPLWKTNMPFQKFEKSVALLSNGTSCIKPLERVVSKAWQMFNSRAYYHQYAKHGLEEEDFINAFVKIESVLSSYKNL